MLRAPFAIAALLLTTAAPARAALVYDKPLSTETVTIPGEHGRQPMTYNCRRYPAFVLKSALWGTGPYGQHFVLPSQGTALPCVPEPAGARTALYGKVAGVKGRYIISDDASPGHDYFSIYDTATRKYVLNESAAASPDSMTVTADGFVLRYRRIYQASCSLFYGTATACWTTVKAATGLTDAAVPDCHASYDAVQRKWQVTAEKMRQRSSQITYEVAARYAGGKLTYTALAGPATCSSGY